jgi:pyruvate dehydrogenase E2 component (dihydrolipoamide acetyltransferase)
VKNDRIEIATVMTVTLTCDHRVVDGATGAKWLQHFKQFVETPEAMLL